MIKFLPIKVGSEVLTAVNKKMAVFLIVAPCSLVNFYQTTRRYKPEDSHLLSSSPFTRYFSKIHIYTGPQYTECPHEISPINKPIEVKPTTDRNTRVAALFRATQKVYFIFFQRSCKQSVAALQSTIRKMASPQERAQCVVWFSETKSLITVQRNYRSDL
jgi:hypothetical protein